MIKPVRRADVDGLRAIAACAVLAYHYFPTVLPGGFIGVDVFFVVSGFVVTRSIAADIASGAFHYSEFYFKRIRRLFPAIILVTAFCLAAAWTFSFPDEFRAVAKDVFYCLTYLANFHFARNTGYFDTPVLPSPLLHFWSLAAEEQFYFIWPALFVFATSLPRRIAFYAIGGTALLSAAGSVYLSSRFPAFSFYLLPTRMWEFLLGALLVLRTYRSELSARAESITSLVGAVGIVGGCIFMSGQIIYPGTLAFIPTIATALIISINRRVLSAPLLLWLGARSYQLYIWHWPLLIIYPWVFDEDPPMFARWVMVALTILFAHVTSSYAEAPLKSLRGARLRIAALCCAGVTVLMAGLSVAILKEPISARLPSLAGIIDDWTEPREVEVISPGRKHSIVFFGDSYVQQLLPRAKKLNSQQPLTIQLCFLHGVDARWPSISIADWIRAALTSWRRGLGLQLSCLSNRS